MTSPTGTFALEEGVNAVPECTTAYTKISSGSGSYSITQFNTEHSTTATHFVVYTIRINTTKYANYYISAYLKLAPNAEGGVTERYSKAIGFNVEKTENGVGGSSADGSDSRGWGLAFLV